MKKLQNSNEDQTQKLKLKLGQNLKSDKTLKTQIVTKLKKLKISNCNMTKIVIKHKNSDCDKTKKNSNCDKTQILKL